MNTMKNSLAGGLLAVAALAAGIGGMSYSPSVEAQAVGGNYCVVYKAGLGSIDEIVAWLQSQGCRQGDVIVVEAFAVAFVCSFQHPIVQLHWTSVSPYGCVYRGGRRAVKE